MRPTILSLLAAPFAALLITACEPSATDSGTTAEGASMPAMPQAEQRAAEHMGLGTVNTIDQAAGTVSISHGPVASASWPAMTMTFKLADPSAATNVMPGDKVEFRFTIESGMAATVTQVSKQPAE